MGVIKKIAKIANPQNIQRLATASGADKAVNSLKSKIGKADRPSATEKCIANRKMKKYLIIQTRSYSITTIAGVLSGKMTIPDNKDSLFVVIDENERLKYYSDIDFGVFQNDIFFVYEPNKGVIGNIKEWVVSIGVPLFEKEVKKCTVNIGKEKVCDLKKYVSFGDLEIDTLDGKGGIKPENEGCFKLLYDKKIIAQLHSIPTLKAKNGYRDVYFLEYDDEEYETIAVLLAIAADHLIV